MGPRELARVLEVGVTCPAQRNSVLKETGGQTGRQEGGILDVWHRRPEAWPCPRPLRSSPCRSSLGRGPCALVHPCVPSTQNSTWHKAAAQKNICRMNRSTWGKSFHFSKPQLHLMTLSYQKEIHSFPPQMKTHMKSEPGKYKCCDLF